MVQKKRINRRKSHDRLLAPDAAIHRGQIRCDLMLAALDREQKEMDLKWGIDRLVGLVPVEDNPKYADAVARFGEVYEDLMRAVDQPDPMAVQQLVPRVVKGLQVLDGICDREGIEHSNPKIIEMEVNGWHVGIIANADDWKAAAAARPDLTITTLREAVVALEHFNKRDWLTEAKAKFPGAEVVAIKPKRNPEDPIPF